MAEVADAAFLGTGWAFPPDLDESGDVAMVTGPDDVHQAIRIILGTIQGERVMRPGFGSPLNAMVFEVNDAATSALVRHRVEESLIRFEPRIDSLQVSVTSEQEAGRLLVSLTYRIRSTNTFYNLVYPFYFLEGDQP